MGVVMTESAPCCFYTTETEKCDANLAVQALLVSSANRVWKSIAFESNYFYFLMFQMNELI